MVINNYSVAMNAQYFNLQEESTNVKISTQKESFASDKSLEIETTAINSAQTTTAEDELSIELSKAVLKNISSEANRFLRDRVEMTYSYTEQESLNYQVQAFIQTDSKEIELSLDVSLSRSFTYKSNITIESLKALQDPLIISFDTKIPTLSTKTFSFDIDSDGESDQISQLNAGNAFLALDKNTNNKIDNGNELFGTASGDGFGDLSAYDDDKNGWIDENDAIFDKLRVWQKSDKEDKLLGLGEVGIGAIFLGATATPFTLKDNSNELLGQIRESSFFLYENGSAGLISQVDLAISPQTADSLNNLDDAQKRVSTLNLQNLYNNETQISEASGDKKMKILQEKIKELESKLTTAQDEERASIQLQIGTLFAQMMMILEADL